MTQKLLTADKFGLTTTSNFKKAAPPPMGDQFAPNWAGAGHPSYQLPGGGLLMFDLDRLTLSDYRAMRNHYQINISLRVLSFMVHQSEWKIECEDKGIQEFISQAMHEVWTRLIRATSTAYWAGYAPIAIEYKNDAQGKHIIIDKFKDLAPEDAWVNWKEVDGYAKPGHLPPKIKTFDGIKVRGQTDPIPATSSLWYPVMMERGDYYGSKLLKPAFAPWFYSQIMHLYANRYFERFGEPLPIGRAPFEDEIEIDGQARSGKEVMVGILSALKNRSAVVLPNTKDNSALGANGQADYEYDIKYLDSQMRGADWERYLSRLDEEMSLGIFTPVLLYRTADVGSYNLGEAHMQIFLIMVNSLIGDLQDYINRYIINRLVDFNYSPKAPRARFVPRRLGKEQQATLRAILQAMIQNERAKVDVEDLGLALGMKVTEIEPLVNDDPEPAPDNTSEDDSEDDRPTTSNNSLEDIGNRMADRLRGQINAAFKRGSFPEQINPGYSRALHYELIRSGYKPDEADSAVTHVFASMRAWLSDACSIEMSAYPGGADEFTANFRSVLAHQLEKL